jgi:hypothetical protein
MHRDAFRSTDPADLAQVMDECQVGHLGILTPDGYPRPVPVSFAWDGERVVLHGALAGEKFDVMAAEARVAFSAHLAYAAIPSDLLGGESACEATHLYKSVLVRGMGAVLSAPEEKVEALGRLMGKYQPEGGYRELSAADDEYGQMLSRTAVLAVRPHAIDVKVYMGQELTPTRRARLVEALRRRGDGQSLATAREIERYAPRE